SCRAHCELPLRRPHQFPTRGSSDLSLTEVAYSPWDTIALTVTPSARPAFSRYSAAWSRSGSGQGRSLGSERKAGDVIGPVASPSDRKSTRLNSSHVKSSYAVFCVKK